jgi:predicted enzyme related to lactoylglutathione lyase
MLLFACVTSLLPAIAVPVAASEMRVAPGAIVWYDLLTEDAGEARAFYAGLFGWEIVEHSADGWVALHHGRPIAGISEIGGDLPEADESIWLVGIAVTDVDDAIDRARRRGAEVHVEPETVAGFARYAVVTDPEGAPVMLLDPERDLGTPPSVGGWVWTELWAGDVDAAERFYGDVVGFERSDTRVGDRPYRMLETGGTPRAGLVAIVNDSIKPVWAPYIAVADLGGTLDRLRELGGSVVVEPSEDFGGATVALVADPTGAAFFVVRPGREEEVSP